MVCNQSGIKEIGNNAPLANNNGRFTRFAIAISVSHFFILNAIATNMHENPAASINNAVNINKTIFMIKSAKTNPVGIIRAMMNTKEH